VPALFSNYSQSWRSSNQAMNELETELKGQVVLVTGASRGLGREIAAELARAGSNVVMMARNEVALIEAQTAVLASRRSSNQSILALAGDVSDSSDVNEVVSTAYSQLGRIDGLVCNAGVHGAIGPVDDVPWDQWLEAVNVNLFGVVHCCRAVVPIMRSQSSGNIVAISGGGATAPLPRFSAYAASKAAVVRFVETLAAELDGSGITVNAVAPGMLNTRLLDEVVAAGPDRVGRDYYTRVVEARAQGTAPPEVAARLVRLLVSKESAGITGRLISATWDNWTRLPAMRERLRNSDVYTLRRIVPEDRGWEDV
jgi:NAD(P)-dependent dehydrogenase (short-subunit alcohol dehydrogenase family)